MRSELAIYLLCLAMLGACQPRNPEHENLTKTEIAVINKEKAVEKLILEIRKEVRLGASDIFIIPLSTVYTSRKRGWSSDSYESYESSSYGDNWNLLFYNYETEDYHLLDSTRRMIVNSYSSADRVTKGQVNNRLVLNMIVDDYNDNGELNGSDPNYLFTCTKEGKKLTQISPKYEDVISWSYPDSSSTIFFRALRDTDQDSIFEGSDAEILYRMDLNNPEGIKEMIPSEYLEQLKELYYDHWHVPDSNQVN